MHGWSKQVPQMHVTHSAIKFKPSPSAKRNFLRCYCQPLSTDGHSSWGLQVQVQAP